MSNYLETLGDVPWDNWTERQTIALLSIAESLSDIVEMMVQERARKEYEAQQAHASALVARYRAKGDAS